MTKRARLKHGAGMGYIKASHLISLVSKVDSLPESSPLVGVTEIIQHTAIQHKQLTYHI